VLQERCTLPGHIPNWNKTFGGRRSANGRFPLTVRFCAGFIDSKAGLR
jgi:hypothetical protein